MQQYAVAFSEERSAIWIEFYWADDAEHAREQAINANEDTAIEAIAFVPTEDNKEVSPA